MARPLETGDSRATLRPQTVLRLCGYCQTWNSRPCGNQCYLQVTDPTWESVAGPQPTETPGMRSIREDDDGPDELAEQAQQLLAELREPGSGAKWGPPITADAADLIEQLLIDRRLSAIAQGQSDAQ